MDEYIVFVLGVDTTKISQYIRQKLDETCDLYEMYESCKFINKKFEEYDKQYYNIYSQIESFYNFLEDYEDEIIAYLDGEIIDFYIKKEN